jgi:hypothetical protein
MKTKKLTILYYNIAKIRCENTIIFYVCYYGLLPYFFFVFFLNYYFLFYFFNIELVRI